METNHNHWVVINGSPRRGMNSDRLIEALFQTKAFKNSEKTLYKLSNLNVSPCRSKLVRYSENDCLSEASFIFASHVRKRYAEAIAL